MLPESTITGNFHLKIEMFPCRRDTGHCKDGVAIIESLLYLKVASTLKSSYRSATTFCTDWKLQAHIHMWVRSSLKIENWKFKMQIQDFNINFKIPDSYSSWNKKSEPDSQIQTWRDSDQVPILSIEYRCDLYTNRHYKLKPTQGNSAFPLSQSTYQTSLPASFPIHHRLQISEPLGSHLAIATLTRHESALHTKTGWEILYMMYLLHDAYEQRKVTSELWQKYYTSHAIHWKTAPDSVTNRSRSG